VQGPSLCVSVSSAAECSRGCVESRGYLCSVNTGFRRISNRQALFFAVGNFRQDCRHFGLTPRTNCCFLWHKEVESPFLAAVAKLRKMTISFIMSVRPPAWNNAASQWKEFNKN
jgi:hypothetical protein